MVTNTTEDASCYLTYFLVHDLLESHQKACLGRPASVAGYYPWDRDSGLPFTTKRSLLRPWEGAQRPQKTKDITKCFLLTALSAESKMEENVKLEALLAEASLALDERLSTHPALRATTLTGG